MSWKRYKRALIVTALSVVVFGLCVGFANEDDTKRYVRSLHRAHQGDKFTAALKQVNARDRRSFNECTACHAEMNALVNLVVERPPVEDAACGRCHAPGDKPDAAPGRAFVGEGARAIRPAHGGKDVPDLVGGLKTSRDGRYTVNLRCAECHPDHLGAEFVKGIEIDHDTDEKTPKVRKIIVHDPCIECHLPGGNDSDSQLVLKTFIEKHGPTALDPGIGESKTRDEVLSVLSKQVDASYRACTPACHSEHVPVAGQDMSE